MSTRAFVPACLWLLAVSGAALAEPRRSRLEPWERFDERDGIELFRREVPGSGIVALRGEGVVDAPLGLVAAVVLDPERATQWLTHRSETRVVRRVSASEYVKWDRVSSPLWLADRDFVFKVKVDFKQRDEQLLISFQSVKDSSAPKSSCVRGELIYGSYLLTAVDAGRTRVRCEELCDPKGNLGHWVANLLQRNWPRDTLVGLRDLLKDPAIRAQAGRTAARFGAELKGDQSQSRSVRSSTIGQWSLSRA